MNDLQLTPVQLDKIVTPDATLTVRTKNLSKNYGKFKAVEALNLEIWPGSVFGFIGPNGAGKTTTMRMLATLLEPTDGDAWICGLSISDRSPNNLVNVRSCIGYMPDFIGIYDRMTVLEYLDFFAAAYFIDSHKRKSLIDDLISLVDLGGKRDTYIEGLSRGMTQRLALARTLIHDPKLLILDEPASGLDPRARIELRELLKELSRMGKTILISSHILTELAEMCSHVGIIERGQLLANGRVSDIMRKFSSQSRLVQIKLGALPTERVSSIGRILSEGPGVQQARQLELNNGWELQVEGNELELQTLLRYLIQEDLPVYSFNEQPTNLEDLFMQVTKGYVS